MTSASEEEIKYVQFPRVVPNLVQGEQNKDVVDNAEPATLMHLPDSTIITYDGLCASLLPPV